MRLWDLQEYNDNFAAFAGVEDLKREKVSGCQKGYNQCPHLLRLLSLFFS